MDATGLPKGEIWKWLSVLFSMDQTTVYCIHVICVVVMCVLTLMLSSEQLLSIIFSAAGDFCTVF